MGFRGNYTCTLNWDLIALLYAAGHGVKAIGKQAGGSPAAIREGLIKRGLYQFGQNRKCNQTGNWAGYYAAEIRPMIDAERAHNKWWRTAFKRRPMDYYYANHEKSKQRGALLSLRRYHRIKHTAEYKAKQFARNQLQRIARQVRQSQIGKRSNSYLGCTYEQAATYITSLLPPHWNWDNYGIEWEIDHRVQLSDGSLLDDAHLHRICHYTNLRPLAVGDNRRRKRGTWFKRQRIA